MSSSLDRRRFLQRSFMAGGAAVALKSFEESVLGAELAASPTPATSAPPFAAPLSLPTGGEFLTRLDLLPIAAKTTLGDGPALILIGQAVGAAVLPQRAVQSAKPATVR